MRRRSAAALAAALLSGCTLAPRYERPAAPVAPAWPAPPPPVPEATGPAASSAPPGPGMTEPAPAPVPTTSTPAEDLGWRDVLADPRLQALVAIALEDNRDLRVAALGVEEARAQFRIQRSLLLPTVTASANTNTQRTPADLSTTGQATSGTSYAVGVGLTSYELDLFGRLRSLSAGALEAYLATEEARRSVHIALVAGVASQELALRALDDQVDLARRTLETVQRSYELTRITYQAGRTSELDLRTAESQVQTARVNLSTTQQQRARAEHALSLLIGRPLPPDLPPAQPLDAVVIVADLPSGIPSEVLQRRPDVLAAEHALVSANAVIGAARAAFFPSITLTGSAGTASLSLSHLFGDGSQTWSFVPRITIPIFAGGALRASLDLAEVRKSIQIARYERAVQVAFREVADALVARAALDQELRFQLGRVEAESRRYQLSELRYRKGIDSYLNVLTAQRDLYAAQQALIQSRLARLTNAIDLYRALGGGWSERSAATAPDGSAAKGG